MGHNYIIYEDITDTFCIILYKYLLEFRGTAYVSI